MKRDVTLNKIVFVQHEMEDKIGPMILTGFLKSHGHEAEIVVDPIKNIKTIQEKKPAFIGISVFSSSINRALKIVNKIKRDCPNSLIILGGPHPTFYPEVINSNDIDIVCIGEGEKPLHELLSSYDGTIHSIENTSNCWVKNGSKITKNQLGPLLTEDELTQLPNCDRTYYNDYPTLRNSPYNNIWTSRGCPYSCHYCFNHKYKQLYKGLGKMVRRRSVESSINEMKELKNIGSKCFNIIDDNFLFSEDWVLEFCKKYEQSINLPFLCNSTANNITSDVVAALKKAGCRMVLFAIESGQESIRKKVYNKPVSDDSIYNAAEILHSYDMPFLTYNMVGLPEETLEDIYSTIEINQKIKPTYAWCSIIQPYPGTKILEHFNNQGTKLKQDFTYSIFTSSVIDDKEKMKIISNAQKLFSYFVKFNTNYEKVCSLIQNPPLKIDKLYPLVFYWHFGNYVKKKLQVSWFMLFRYWLYSLKN